MRGQHGILGALVALVIAFGAGPAGANSGGGSGDEPDKLESARSAIEDGAYEAALADLEALLPEHADNADVHNLRGYALRNLGRVEAAKTAYRKALDIDAEHRGALEYLGQLYVNEGQLAKARDMLDRLDDACGFFGCDEKDELEAAIQAAEGTG